MASIQGIWCFYLLIRIAGKKSKKGHVSVSSVGGHGTRLGQNTILASICTQAHYGFISTVYSIINLKIMIQYVLLFSRSIRNSLHTQNLVRTIRAVASGGLGGLQSPPVFGQTVNPISTRGADYAHHSTMSPPPRIFRPCDGPAVRYQRSSKIF